MKKYQRGNGSQRGAERIHSSVETENCACVSALAVNGGVRAACKQCIARRCSYTFAYPVADS